MLVNGNEVTVKRGVVGYGEAQAVFGIEAVLFVFCPCMRVVPLEDRARYVKRTDIGRDLAAPVRVRGEYEICKRLSQHGGNKYSKSATYLVKNLWQILWPASALRVAQVRIHTSGKYHSFRPCFCGLAFLQPELLPDT